MVGFDGLPVMLVSGAVVSTVQVKEAGLASLFPALSTARTWKVWLPSARLARLCGLVQALKPPLSRSHSKLATPLPVPSLPVKPKLALVLLVGFDGLLVMLVSGALASTTQV